MAGGKGGSVGVTTTRLNGIQVQTSVYGSPIARGWGTFRMSSNLLWYGDFEAIAKTERASAGGKGGGGGRVTNTSYEYRASLIMGLCAGPIVGIRTVYRDQGVSNGLGGTGLSLVTGEVGQEPWAYLTTRHPSEAIGYSGIAYLYAQGYPLSSSATIGNHSFEVQTTTRVAGLDDANPADIVVDFLESVPYWGAGLISDLSDYAEFCLASDYLLSPLLDAQVQAASFLREILACSDSDCVWSDGVLKIIPLGDLQVSGNGATWAPDLDPIYDLDEDDFSADGDEDPVQYELKRPADAYNYVQIKYQDRANQYNEQVMPGIDQASIDEFGLRKQDPVQMYSIKRTELAVRIAQVMVQRSANVRAKYRFRLPWNFCLLEPLDLLTITDPRLGLFRQLVRIEEIGEEEDEYSLIVEEVLVGVAQPAEIQRQDPGGFLPDREVYPGNTVNPLFLNPPRSLTGGAYEVWVAASGGPDWGGAEVWVSLNDEAYERRGTITGRARYGYTTSVLEAHPVAPPPAGYNPVTPPGPGYVEEDAELSVTTAVSQGAILPATQADVDGLVSICAVGSEIIAYRDAELTSPGNYTLSYLRRALFGTGNEEGGPPAQPIGSPFVRLDDNIFQLPYLEGQIGQTVRIKLLSFNSYQRALQRLDEVEAYTFLLTPSGALFVPINWSDIGNIPRGPGDLTPDGDIRAENVRLPDGRRASDVFDDLAEVADLGEQLGAGAADRINAILDSLGDGEDLAISVMRLAQETADVRSLITRLGYTEGLPVGPVIREEIRQRQEGEDTILEVIDLIGIVGDAGSSFILNTSTVKYSPTETLASVITGLTSGLGDAFAEIAQEATTRASEIEAEATLREALEVRVDDNEAAILQEATTRASEIEAEATLREALASVVAGNSAAIVSEASTRATADAAFATNFTLLGARNGGSTAWILNESTTQVGSRGTMASVLNALIAADGSNSAAISSEAVVRANADGSLASSISSLSSTVGGNSASITTLFSVTNGLYARAALVLNVNGRITGYEINGATGTIVFAADTFAVATQAAGTAYFPLLISGGKVRFSADVAIDGGLVVSGSVTASQIVSEGITRSVSSTTASAMTLSQSPQSIQDATITTRGGRLETTITFFLDFWHPTAGDATVYMEVYRDGATVFSDFYNAIGGDFLFGSWVIPITETLGAGTYTYSCAVWYSNVTPSNRIVKNRSIRITEYLR